jgi:hypothetical protein
MHSKIRYRDLRTSLDDKDEFDLPHQEESASDGNDQFQPRNNKRAILAIAAFATLVLYTAVIAAIPRTLQILHTHNHPFNHTDIAHGSCGNSPSEAEALGCKFDIMYWGWLHPNCYNETESRIWEQKYGPWPWKKRFPNSDPWKNEDVPRDKLKYETAVFATDHYHWAHCLYSFKMVHMAALNGYMVSPEVGPLSHTDHCIQRIYEYDSHKPNVFQTDVHNYYSVCYKLRE